MLHAQSQGQRQIRFDVPVVLYEAADIPILVNRRIVDVVFVGGGVVRKSQKKFRQARSERRTVAGRRCAHPGIGAGGPVEIKVSCRIAWANFSVFVDADIRTDLERVPPPYLGEIGKELQAGEPLDRAALGAECLESGDVEYRQVQIV